QFTPKLPSGCAPLGILRPNTPSPTLPRQGGGGLFDALSGAVTQAIQIVVGGLVQGSVFAVVALGIALVYRVTGIINLAQGGFCILGALISYSCAVGLSWPMPLAIAASLIATTAIGLALGAATFVPALAHLPNRSMLMLTAGLLTVIEGLAL